MRAADGYHAILVGVDFSQPSREALSRALDLARRLGARVEVVYVERKLQPAVPFSRRNREAVARLQKQERAYVAQRLEEFLPARPGVPVRTRVLIGVPHEQILARSTRVRADLIVLANHGRTLREKLLIGSTADRVLREADRPVLLVPETRRKRRRASAAKRGKTRSTRR